MTVLARLFGDMATVPVPTRMDGQDGQDMTAQGGQEDLRRMLDQSFGRVVEGGTSGGTSSSGQFESGTGLRCLQLSLEEAFYLKHVDESIELAIVDPIPVHPLRKRVEPCRGTCDSARGEWDEPLHKHGRRDQDEAPEHAKRLSDAQAWQYCCLRRSRFPATFAVYRHFRSKGYTVHTGHKYGAHFVLYEGSPDECHSRYCVHVMDAGGGDSWGHMKTMTRLMPDIAKSLLVCGVSYNVGDDDIHIEARGSNFSRVNPSSLEALSVAKVSALSFARPSDGDGSSTTAAGDVGSSRGKQRRGAKASATAKGGRDSRKSDGTSKRKKKKPREESGKSAISAVCSSSAS